MKMRLFCWVLLLHLPLFARIDPSDWDGALASVEESHFLRRIADFWQEGEYRIAKGQMRAFLLEFPESAYANPLRVCLGDLSFHEKNYAEALTSYSSVSSSEFAEKVFLNRLQCLYHLEWYSTLADECEAYLKHPTDLELRLKTVYFLAISLYHQCLNASKDPELLRSLAQRAEPHFETLLEGELSTELSQAFAHLCCILQDYPKAVALYQDLAEKDPSIREAMSFQAALIQAEYDKEGALRSFEQIVKNGGEKKGDAAYNQLVLLFDLGSYEHLISKKEAFLAEIPKERQGLSHLFFGRSLLALKQYEEAIKDLQSYLEQDPSSEEVLSCLLEAAYQSDQLSVLDDALRQLKSMDSSSLQVVKGSLSRVFLLKKKGSYEEALHELGELLTWAPQCPERSRAAFEMVDLSYQMGEWELCRTRSYAFIEQHEMDPLIPSAWRFLGLASYQLVATHPEQFASDLATLLQHKDLFSPSECSDWTFFLGKTLYDLGALEKATDLLEALFADKQSSFTQEGNALLLLGLCYRDFLGNQADFCLYAERAIVATTDLLDVESLSFALFNAYLDLSKQAPTLLERAAEHLFHAFAAQAEITKENLLWLGEWYFSHFEEGRNPLFAERAEKLFSSIDSETAMYKLGALFGWTGKVDRQVSTLEKLHKLYEEGGSFQWKSEAELLLAEGYIALGQEKEAIAVLNEMIDDHSVITSEALGKAKLQRARLEIKRLTQEKDDPALFRVASELKDLILQRRLANEPLYLEAALEYVDLLGNRAEKRLSLLNKVKEDFESSSDLLAQDYQQARLKLQDKNQIYEGYLQLIQAEIFLAQSELEIAPSTQKELQAKAKDLLLQIKEGKAHPLLENRSFWCLQHAQLDDVSSFE